MKIVTIPETLGVEDACCGEFTSTLKGGHFELKLCDGIPRVLAAKNNGYWPFSFCPFCGEAIEVGADRTVTVVTGLSSEDR